MATMYVSLVTIILIFLYLLSMNSNIGTLINEISPFFGGNNLLAYLFFNFLLFLCPIFYQFDFSCNYLAFLYMNI